MSISGEEEEKSINYNLIRSRIKRIMDLIPALTFYHTINRVRKRRRRGRRQKGGGKVDFEQYTMKSYMDQQQVIHLCFRVFANG